MRTGLFSWPTPMNGVHNGEVPLCSYSGLLLLNLCALGICAVMLVLVAFEREWIQCYVNVMNNIVCVCVCVCVCHN